MRMRWDGGGPAGLFAILARANDHEVTVDEQAQPADSFGLGVDFWDGLLRQLDVYDPETGRLVRQYAIPSFGYTVLYGRQLKLLRSKAIEVGVHIEVGRITDMDVVARSTDLVIASAGVNSTLRRQQADFIPGVTRLRNCPIWLDSGGRVDSLWPAPGPTTADAAVAA